jgi:hypothetical protein
MEAFMVKVRVSAATAAPVAIIMKAAAAGRVLIMGISILEFVTPQDSRVAE